MPKRSRKNLRKLSRKNSRRISKKLSRKNSLKRKNLRKRNSMKRSRKNKKLRGGSAANFDECNDNCYKVDMEQNGSYIVTPLDNLSVLKSVKTMNQQLRKELGVPPL
tara:strand:- start:399 stop:719 length:321 start_codon:yes stop_codon:yes gene_type:complete